MDLEGLRFLLVSPDEVKQLEPPGAKRLPQHVYHKLLNLNLRLAICIQLFQLRWVRIQNKVQSPHIVVSHISLFLFLCHTSRALIEKPLIPLGPPNVLTTLVNVVDRTLLEQLFRCRLRLDLQFAEGYVCLPNFLQQVYVVLVEPSFLP